MSFKDVMKTFVVLFFAGCFILPATFENQDFLLEDDGTAIMVKKSYWGLKKEYIQLKSMNDKWYYLDKKSSKWEELVFDDRSAEDYYE